MSDVSIHRYFFLYFFILRILSMKDSALHDSNPDEYLYGRAGYLYTLMFLRKEIRDNIIDNQLITEVNRRFLLLEIIVVIMSTGS